MALSYRLDGWVSDSEQGLDNSVSKTGSLVLQSHFRFYSMYVPVTLQIIVLDSFLKRSWAGTGNFLFTTMSRLAVGPT